MAIDGAKFTSRNLIMDAMRGVASLMVALFHFNEPIPFAPNFWQEFCKEGWLGLPVFFVISGWCMAMITEKERSPLVFLTKRFFRIFPPYWASLAVVGVVVLFLYFCGGLSDVTMLPHSLMAIVATLSLSTTPASEEPTINWVYWSLTYEVTFYVLVAVGLVCRKSGLVLMLILPLCLLRPPYAHNDSYGGPLFFADQYPLFALGFFARGWKLNWRSLALIGVTAGLCFIAAGAPSAWVALATIVLLAWSEWRPHPVRKWLRPLATLGDWSYSLYLIHVPLGCYLLLHLRSEGFLDNIFLHMGFDLAALSICVAFAWFLHVTVEQPSHRLGQLTAGNLKPQIGRG